MSFLLLSDRFLPVLLPQLLALVVVVIVAVAGAEAEVKIELELAKVF